MPQCSSLAELNEHSRAFWAVEALRAEKRMKDLIVSKFALARIKQQLVMEIPVRQQTTLEYELEQTDEFRLVVNKAALSNFGRRGGRAKKKDRLQQLVDAYVAEHPGNSIKSLEDHLENLQHGADIEQFTETFIEFFDHDDKLKTAPRSGLKHRFTRARKAMKES